MGLGVGLGAGVGGDGKEVGQGSGRGGIGGRGVCAGRALALGVGFKGGKRWRRLDERLRWVGMEGCTACSCGWDRCLLGVLSMEVSLGTMKELWIRTRLFPSSSCGAGTGVPRTAAHSAIGTPLVAPPGMGGGSIDKKLMSVTGRST